MVIAVAAQRRAEGQKVEVVACFLRLVEGVVMGFEHAPSSLPPVAWALAGNSWAVVE